MEARSQPAAPPAEMVPVEIGERIIEVVAALMDRLDRLAHAVGMNGSDDDANQRSYDRRRARQAGAGDTWDRAGVLEAAFGP
jgi:hypothetical protein